MMNSPKAILDSAQDKVWKVIVPVEQVAELKSKYLIGNLRNLLEQAELRIVSDTRPELENVEAVEPNLEDIYLYYFRQGSDSAIAE